MTEQSETELASAMQRINTAWLEGRPRDLLPLVHPDIVMRHPEFAGTSLGSATFVGGFVDFCENATIDEFQPAAQKVDVVGNTGVVSYLFELRYAQGGEMHRSTGRDLWVFQREGNQWVAVWRTMLDLKDEVAT